MSKGLEALKETAIQIVEALYGKDEPLRNHKINELLETRQFKIIETALKEREELLKENLVLSVKERAFELIKKYNIRPSDFHYHTTYKIYLCNMSFAEKDEIMSEKDYDLLKEVLL